MNVSECPIEISGGSARLNILIDAYPQKDAQYSSHVTTPLFEPVCQVSGSTAQMADGTPKATVALLVDGEEPFNLQPGGSGAPGLLLGRGGQRHVLFENKGCKTDDHVHGLALVPVWRATTLYLPSPGAFGGRKRLCGVLPCCVCLRSSISTKG